MRRVALHARRGALYVLVFAAAAAITLWIVGLVAAAGAGQRAADRAERQAAAQARIVLDQRAATDRRVDLLTRQIDDTRAELAGQGRTVGRQEQAIRDLAAQVRALGGRPVAEAVAGSTSPGGPTSPSGPSSGSRSPRPAGSATPAPRPSPRPSPRPTTRPSTSTPRPTTPPPPAPTGGGLACTLLPILC